MPLLRTPRSRATPFRTNYSGQGRPRGQGDTRQPYRCNVWFRPTDEETPAALKTVRTRRRATEPADV